MIWWWFTKKYEFSPEWGKKIQLTKGLSVKYTVITNGARPAQMKFEVWLNENHYVITKGINVPFITFDDVRATYPNFDILIITRNKNVITLEINQEKRTYYLKTPPIWKLK